MKKLMKFEKKHAAKKLMLLRLVVGVIFIAHGLAKWGLWQASPSEQISVTMLWILRVLSIVEPIAGLAMVLGLFVPIAGVIFVIIMLGAIPANIFMFNKPFVSGWAYELLILVSSLVLISQGGGKFSMDEMMMKKKSAAPMKDSGNQMPGDTPSAGGMS